MHCSTELGGDPEQRQELPSMDYPHGSALPSPPWPCIPLPKQGVLYSILTALCTHSSTLLLDGSLHCGLMDITPGTGQAWLSQCRLHGTHGCFGDGLWIERVPGHLIPVTLLQINQCIWLQVCLPVKLNSVFNAFYISSVATGCLSRCKWLFKDSLPCWQTHFASLQTAVKS